MTNTTGDSSLYTPWGLLAPEHRIPIPNGGPQDVASVLDDALARTPYAEAVVGRHARHTYVELEALVNSAAAGLAALGVQQGQHIGCSSTSHPDILIAFMAVQRLGCVWIGIPPKLATPEKTHILRDCEARMFISDGATLEDLADELASLTQLEHLITMEPGNPKSTWARMIARFRGAGRAQVNIDPWAPAAIAYTSGTTGFPKGVVHSQHNLVLLGASRIQTNPKEFCGPKLRQGVFQPPAILNVIAVAVLTSWMAGGTCVCVDRNDAVGVAQWIERERIEAAIFAPATIFDLLTMPEIDQRALDSLRHIAIGGGPASEELRALVTERFGAPPLMTYGLTEAPGQVALSRLNEPLPAGASGRAHPHIRIAILGADGEILPSGMLGEVCIGPSETGPWTGVYTPMLGYWKNPEATAKSLRGGWLRTGDIGSLDEEGYLSLTGRLNDVIIRGGANIYPAEIERVLEGLDTVRACAVLGRPDPRLGETVEAFVQLMPTVTANETVRATLALACRAKLANYKVPAHWTFVDDMPRNSMNKIIKNKLRELYVT